jgi:hypothetical protein
MAVLLLTTLDQQLAGLARDASGQPTIPVAAAAASRVMIVGMGKTQDPAPDTLVDNLQNVDVTGDLLMF